MHKITGRLLAATFLLGSLGCSGPMFQQLGGGFFGSSPISGSQVNALFKAGSKIVSAAGPLTEEQEYYLGRSVSAMVLSQYHLYNDTALNNYVNTVGNAVAAFSDRPETFGGYHFAVLDSQELNALSAPGGFVFITRGFLTTIPDEDALAAVLAHEVGHIVMGHGVKAISQANLSEAVLILGKEAAASYSTGATQALTSAFGDSVTDVFGTLLKGGYSRSQEYEADEYAAALLAKSGYSQASLVTMLQGIQKASSTGKSGGWYSTHPAPEKRIEELGEDLQVADASGVKTRTERFKRVVR